MKEGRLFSATFGREIGNPRHRLFIELQFAFCHPFTAHLNNHILRQLLCLTDQAQNKVHLRHHWDLTSLAPSYLKLNPKTTQRITLNPLHYQTLHIPSTHKNGPKTTTRTRRACRPPRCPAKGNGRLDLRCAYQPRECVCGEEYCHFRCKLCLNKETRCGDGRIRRQVLIE